VGNELDGHPNSVVDEIATVVTEGEQVVVADVGTSSEVAYEVLCRRHHMRGVTARNSRAGHVSHDSLPFNQM
jgi:thymidine kinase